MVHNHWGADRVSYVGPGGRSRSLPIEWTDLAGEDAFVTMARGRAPLRLADLLELRALVPRARRARGRAGRDKRIMPQMSRNDAAIDSVGPLAWRRCGARWNRRTATAGVKRNTMSRFRPAGAFVDHRLQHPVGAPGLEPVVAAGLAEKDAARMQIVLSARASQSHETMPDPVCSDDASSHEGSEPRTQNSSTPKKDGLDLMRRVKAGDHEAFGTVLGMYWHPLVLYAEALLGCLDSAYDAVQEAFVRLWEGRRKWQTSGSVRVWLFRTVRNVCISQQRKRSVRARWAAGVGGVSEPQPSTPLEETENAELRAAIENALGALPSRRREAFTLFYLRDLSYREVADVMGIREQTVANYLQAALAELRRALKDRFHTFGIAGPESEAWEPDDLNE